MKPMFITDDSFFILFLSHVKSVERFILTTITYLCCDLAILVVLIRDIW